MRRRVASCKRRGRIVLKMVERNPDWSEDELVVALDGYVRIVSTGDRLEVEHPVVGWISNVLNKLEMHQGLRGQVLQSNSPTRQPGSTYNLCTDIAGSLSSRWE